MKRVKQAVSAIFKKREEAQEALSTLRNMGYQNLALHAKAVFSESLLPRKPQIDNPIFSGAEDALSPAQRLLDATSFAGIYQSQGELLSPPKRQPAKRHDFADYLGEKGLPHEKVNDYRQALDNNRFVVLVQADHQPEHSAAAEQVLQQFHPDQVDAF